MRLALKIHALPVAIFLLITFFLTAGRMGTSFRNFALLTPDLGVYASFAAAQEHPELFANDPLSLLRLATSGFFL